MERIYGAWAGRAIAWLIIWTAFASVFSLLARDTRACLMPRRSTAITFAPSPRVDPEQRFPTVSLLALGGVAMLFCFLRLADVIAALVVIRILLQFIVQAVGVIVLRQRAARHAASFPHVALSVAGAHGDRRLSLCPHLARKNFLREIRYAFAILVLGLVIYFVRSWRHKEWPFATS